MRSAALMLAALCPSLLTSGCESTAIDTALDTGAPNSSVATWHMPWQLNPISAQSQERERTTRIYVEGTGYVRGTPTALAGIGRPLGAPRGFNHTVDTCRATVAGEAEKLGGNQVEAVSAGPDHLNAKGQYVGPVLFRINYARAGGHEIREAVLTCIVDQNNKIVDAFAARRRT